ncbi:MAG: ATP-grasp domain-containing protein [Candidatus Omnitrophota bacterium]
MKKNFRLLIAVNGENCGRKDVSDASRCGCSIAETAASENWETKTLLLTPELFENNFARLKNYICSYAPDCIFNLFEGFSFSSAAEYKFAEFIESTSFPFTGNSSYTLKVCLDKQMTKKIISSQKINVPKGLFIKSLANTDVTDLEFPLFVKPCFEDASVGIDEFSLIKKTSDLKSVLSMKLKTHRDGVLIEEYLPGREFNIGLMKKPDSCPEIIAISMTSFDNRKGYPPFMSYKAKWDVFSDEYKELVPVILNPHDIETELKESITNICFKTAAALKCSGYFRIDLREKKGQLFVIDVNPNPDINSDSGFIKQAYSAGLNYNETIKKILAYSLTRSVKNEHC